MPSCPSCSGTGLGMFEGTRCDECKGKGEVPNDDKEAEDSSDE